MWSKSELEKVKVADVSTSLTHKKWSLELAAGH